MAPAVESQTPTYEKGNGQSAVTSTWELPELGH